MQTAFLDLKIIKETNCSHVKQIENLYKVIKCWNFTKYILTHMVKKYYWNLYRNWHMKFKAAGHPRSEFISLM